MKKILTHYSVPMLLGMIIFASNFLKTDLFNFGEMNFAVWFVLSFLCFACGWYINRTLGWQFGGKVVFAVLISVTFISIIFIILFKDYFGANELLSENLILYSLRNIALGAMGIFGMSIQETVMGESEVIILREKVKLLESAVEESKKQAELIIKEAELKAEKIVNDADLKSKNTFLLKERVEKELKEIIQTERELLKRYEEL